MDEQELFRSLRGKGYQKIYIWKAKAKEKVPKHQNIFDTHLYILHGKLEVRMEGISYTLKLDDEVDIPKYSTHEVKAGPDGATYIIAERT